MRRLGVLLVACVLAGTPADAATSRFHRTTGAIAHGGIAFGLALVDGTWTQVVASVASGLVGDDGAAPGPSGARGYVMLCAATCRFHRFSSAMTRVAVGFTEFTAPVPRLGAVRLRFTAQGPFDREEWGGCGMRWEAGDGSISEPMAMASWRLHNGAPPGGVASAGLSGAIGRIAIMPNWCGLLVRGATGELRIGFSTARDPGFPEDPPFPVYMIL